MPDASIDAETTRLAIRAQAGDSAAFCALIDLHQRAARRVPLAALGNHADADDGYRAYGRIWLRLVLEYSPPASEKLSEYGTPLNEMVTVLLQSGKPTVISQAADSSMERKVTVEVTATLLK